MLYEPPPQVNKFQWIWQRWLYGLWQSINDYADNPSSVNGISSTTSIANNLRGSVTLSSGTASVTFGTAETDTSYYIALSGNASETFYWASKATTGFTINSSNASSTATVDWVLIR